MNNSLFVTLADSSYIDQAKQVFSSVYWNSGWEGDYMLLAHEIPENELRWFENREILVYRVKPITQEYNGRFSPCLWDKFYLYQEKFKQWRSIVYIDADAAVQASLSSLIQVSTLSSPIDCAPLSGQFDDFSIFETSYDKNRIAFCAGILAFNTSIIKVDTFSKLIDLYCRYESLCLTSDQAIQNLVFYHIWKPLSPDYNRVYCNSYHDLNDATIIHFAGSKRKPWLNKSHFFYQEWLSNLKKAEAINLKVRLSSIKNFDYSDFNDLHTARISKGTTLYSLFGNQYRQVYNLRINADFRDRFPDPNHIYESAIIYYPECTLKKH